LEKNQVFFHTLLIAAGNSEKILKNFEKTVAILKNL